MNPDTEVKTEKPVESIIAQEPVVEQESEKEINWKKFKEARQKDREHAEAMSKKAAEKEAEAQALKAAMDAILNKPQPTANMQQNYYTEEDETEDQRIEKKVQAALELAERKRQEEYARREYENLPQKIKQVHADFDQVCSTENLDYLEYHHPEIAKAYNYMPDNVEKWDAVYRAVKKLVPNTSPNKDANKAQQNLTKPQSMSATTTPQGQGNTPPIHITEQRRAENWARMQKAMKSVS